MTASSILSFGLTTINFCRKIGKFKSLDTMIVEEINVFFRDINQTYQNKLNFVYVADNKWIECNILQQKKKLNSSKTMDHVFRKSNGAEHFSKK